MMNAKKRRWIGVISLALVFAGCSGDENGDVGVATTTTIDEQGGVAESSDGMARADFPEGIVEGALEVTISAGSTPERDDIYTGLYSFEVDGEFDGSVMIEIEATRTMDSDNIRLGRYSDGEVEEIGFSGVSDGAVSGAVSSFSTFGGFDFGSGDSPSTLSESTTIDPSGGVAQSADGLFEVDFPANFIDFSELEFDDESVEITISHQDSASEFGPDEPYRLSHIYTLLASPSLPELELPVTLSLEVDADTDTEVFLIHPEGNHGLSGTSTFDGTRVSVESTDPTGTLLAGYYAVGVQLSERCADLDPLGEACTEEGDECYGSNVDHHCVCEDGTVMGSVGTQSEQLACYPDTSGTCGSIMMLCGGIGVGHGGHCDEDGGWTGDCYVDE